MSDVTAMLLGFFPFIFLAGVFVGHSVANSPGNRFVTFLQVQKELAAEQRTGTHKS